MTDKDKKLEKCGCGCGCDEVKCDCEDGCEDNCEDNCDIVELIDDDGKVVKFIHVATIDYKDNWYVFFSPTEEVEGVNCDEVVIFRLISDEEGNDVFEPIEDEKLLDEVYKEYVNVMEEDCEDDEEDGSEE